MTGCPKPRTPVRVAVFSDALPGRSGVGTYYDDLYEHLHDRVGDVLVIAPSPDRPRPRFPMSLPLPGDKTQRLYLPGPVPAWRSLHRLAPHVVVSATPGPYGALGMAAAHHMNTGFCVSVHTRFDDLAGLYWNRWLAAGVTGIVRSWENLVCRRADAVLVNNQSLLTRIEGEGIRTARLMGTPIPRQFLDCPPRPHGDRVRSVCFIGRLAAEKRLDLVLEAARALPDVRFRIAGDGPLRSTVEAAVEGAIAGNIEYLGWLDRDGVRSTLDDADLLLLPSRYETFGTIALEALSRGTPALVSARCGIVSWDGVADGLFRMSDGETVLSALNRICALEPGTRAEVAARGRAAAEAFTRRTICDWLDVFEEIRKPGIAA